MGDALYDHIVSDSNAGGIACRIYAPVGSHETLLPYLVRRLLENGANSSFVNRIVDESLAIEDLIEDPVQKALQFECKPHPRIKMPIKLFGESRMNSKGYNVDDKVTIEKLKEEMSVFSFESELVSSLIYNHSASVREKVESYNPSNSSHVVSISEECAASDVDIAMREAEKAFFGWDTLPVADRSDCLIKMADLLEEQMPRFMAIAITEAGKTLHNAIDEVREAIDFCRYYAVQAKEDFSSPVVLPGPTGEDNAISLHGRGVVVCISPWNFPLAIFLGQVVAAIAAGNTVVAKPAEQTPLIAYETVKLLYKAGVPRNVVQLVLGKGDIVGSAMIENKYNAGVIFTGSTEVASIIQKQLANKVGAILPFIAETGGQNVLVADSSSLSEQVVGDVINSAFDSAGQRCSALRVLFLQEDIADSMIEMLVGAMKEIKVGDPQWLENDIGPVIDSKAQEKLIQHIDFMADKGELKYQVSLGSACKDGTYVAPTLFEIKDISVLNREVFGPILHIVRYKNDSLDEVVNQVNGSGYGLTFGVHSRIQETIDFLVKRVRAGNIYINRNIVGAVVGVQPFGGQGLSGTGPKAGGPLYLHRLAVERTVSVDTTASGGNASLMAMGE
jgi:RHH-type proline utilization regulon transcriptional repressor/proline dehydrogenase/delta 1-pyrroline-5-carboxylate dehydrogenase